MCVVPPQEQGAVRVEAWSVSIPVSSTECPQFVQVVKGAFAHRRTEHEREHRRAQRRQ
jgi:hypothetical protein